MSEIIGILFSVLAAVIFGVCTVVQKYSLKKIKKFSLAALFSSRGWVSSLILGGVGLAFYLTAIYVYRISSVQVIIAASVVMSVLAGAFFFREKIGVRKWVSILLILIGVAIVVSL
ncbi:MAG: EamA family transporter [Candidatus Aenigmarchaeota archaeon]|nr:EamA family transporter [Candidatus Aenigmarchaeota archaeon]